MYKTTIKIEGMACGMCEAHINDAIRKSFPAAQKVKSSHTKGAASFLLDTPTSEEQLRPLIDATGYTFVSSKSEPYKKKSWFGF